MFFVYRHNTQIFVVLNMFSVLFRIFIEKFFFFFYVLNQSKPIIYARFIALIQYTF